MVNVEAEAVELAVLYLFQQDILLTMDLSNQEVEVVELVQMLEMQRNLHRSIKWE